MLHSTGRRRIRSQAACRIAAAVFGVTLAGVAAAQQDFPSRPITWIYPFAAGSGSDNAYRFVINEASRMTGKQIVYDNRAGGGGRVGYNIMANSKPDGYTVCLTPQGLVVLDGLTDPSLRLEAGKDYQPITQFVESTLILLAHPNVPFKDMKGLVEYAKANPGKLNMGTIAGSGGPIAYALLKLNAGVDLVQVRFKGDAPGQAELWAGRIDLMVGVTGGYKAAKDAGKVIGIASLGVRRSGAAPELATAVEQGYQVAVPNWAGASAPAGTPPEIVNKLASIFNAALNLPESRVRMGTAGLDVVASSPEAFKEHIRSEQERIGNVLRRTGIKLSDD